MKKCTAVLCILGMMLSLTGCIVEEGGQQEIMSAATQKQEDSSAEPADSGLDAADLESDSEADAADEEKTELPQIEEQVLWETDGIKMTATGISEDSFWGTVVNVLVENNSDKDVSISLDALIVNDFMLSDLTVIDVTAGNKANESITIFSSELEAAGIDSIGKIEMYMHMYDPESYDTISESGLITLTTSAPVDSEIDFSGTTLFEQDGIKITGQYVEEDPVWGTSLLLYIENNGSQNVQIDVEDIAVNGFMVSAFGYETIYAGKKTVGEIYLSSEDLEANGISSVETVEMTFRIIDENYSEIANSGKVAFTVQ